MEKSTFYHIKRKNILVNVTIRTKPKLLISGSAALDGPANTFLRAAKPKFWQLPK
jgi:hypothetical protein